jgi:hypothetical protein
MLPSAAPLSAPVGTEKPDAVVSICRRYCITWFFCVVLMITLIGVFNALIDPYYVIGAPRLAGLNTAKPEAITHTQLAKNYLIGRARPAGLLLGTSTVDLGFDPGNRFWPDDARPVFNYGVPGISILGTLTNLRRAITLGTVRRALVVLEFNDFMWVPSQGKAVAASMAVTPLQRAHDIVLATLSLDALRASIVTVITQQQPDPIDLSPEGATNEEGFRKQVRIDGYEQLFLQKNTESSKRLAYIAALLRTRPDAGLANLDVIAEIIAVCRRHGIALDFAFPPVHADLLVQIYRAGLWSRFQSAKAAITHLIAAQGGEAVPLWDFSGFNTVSTEPVPLPSERGVDMVWFWEPSHFKRSLGERMLAAIYGGVAGYGVRLTPQMIEAHLAQETAARDAWMAGNSGKWRERLARVAKLQEVN